MLGRTTNSPSSLLDGNIIFLGELLDRDIIVLILRGLDLSFF